MIEQGRTEENRPRKRTLLAVDDVPGIAELIRTTASDAGFESKAVTEWTDIDSAGIEALDVIVLDLQMPGKDGIEIIRELAANRKGLAVILVTGLGQRMLATASDLAAKHGLRVMGSLAKPFSYEDLFEMLLQVKNDLGTAVRHAPAQPDMDPEALRLAILGNEIHVLYQPIVDIQSGAVVGAEALARWQHPALGTLMPAAFIPVADRYGMTAMLNWEVLRTAVREMKRRYGHCKIPVSVNFSADDFSELDLPDRIAEELREAELPATCLNIELTEGSVIRDIQRSLDTMIRLRMKGVGLWLDDFGTGYSSMEQLRRLPLTALKIDQSFTPHEVNGEHNKAILRSLVELSHKLGLPAIAEGVETLPQLVALRELGCDRAQGFYFASPMPADSLLEWLAVQPSAR